MLQQPRPLVPFMFPKRSFRLPYAQRVLALNPIAYWKLNETSGSAAADSSGNGFGGTYSGAVPGGTTWVDGSPAPSFDGIADLVNRYSSGFASAFDPAHYTQSIWVRLAQAGNWTDATIRFFTIERADGNNSYAFFKSNTANTITFQIRHGGVFKDVSVGSLSSLSWLHLALTVDDDADEAKAFINGVQVGSPQTGLGTWAGALASAQVVLGAFNTGGANSHHGSMAHDAVFDYALSPAQVADLAQAT